MIGHTLNIPDAPSCGIRFRRHIVFAGFRSLKCTLAYYKGRHFRSMVDLLYRCLRAPGGAADIHSGIDSPCRHFASNFKERQGVPAVTSDIGKSKSSI